MYRCSCSPLLPCWQAHAEACETTESPLQPWLHRDVKHSLSSCEQVISTGSVEYPFVHILCFFCSERTNKFYKHSVLTYPVKPTQA